MANIKISELTALTPPDVADLVPVTDTSASQTKRTTVGEIVTTGAKNLERGTAAAPTVAFGGATDANTGIYSPGADQVAISTNGQGRLFVASDGKVGVGTAPGRILHIDSGAVNNSYVRFTNSNSTGNGAEVGLFDSGAANPSLIVANTMADGNISMTAGGNERLQITSNGELKHIGGGTEGDPAVYFAGSAPAKSLYVEATTGHVGLGTSSVSNKLEVYSNTDNSAVAPNSDVSGLTITNASTVTNAYTGLLFRSYGGTDSVYLRAIAKANNQIDFEIGGQTSGQTSASPRLTIDSSGRVGVGTTSPNKTLTVVGDIIGSSLASNGNLVLNCDDNANNAGNDAIIFQERGNEKMRMDGSGRLLVGTSSTSFNTKLLVEGGVDSKNANIVLARSEAPNGTTSGSKELGFLIFAANNHTSAASICGERDGGTWTNGTSQPTRLVFSTTANGASSPTERMRITSAGDIGTSAGLTLGSITPSAGGFYSTTAILGTGAGTNAVKFNTTTGKITYDTSSRLNKDQIENCPYGIAEIKQLQPRRYYRIDDQRLEVGFVADEVVGILPEFVPFGPKSAITGNEQDTEEIPLGVNYEKLTAVLTAALQEAVAKIESLEARLDAANL